MASSFSGSGGRRASMWGAQWAGQQLEALTGIYNEGYGLAGDKIRNVGYYPSAADLRNYYSRQKQYQVQGLNRANKLIGKGMKAAGGALTTGYGDAISSIQDYYGKGERGLQQGVGAWQDFLQQANAGYGMYQNALGLGGASGREAAQNAFQAGPGYQWSVDQAASQAQRAANRTGQTYGGNTASAIARQSQGLANQEWGNWVNQLSGFQGAALQGTQGYAGQLGQLANLYTQEGQNLATLQQQRGRDFGNLYTSGYGGMASNTYGSFNNLAQGAYQYGTDRASLSTNYGNSLAGLDLGKMGDIANATNNYYNTVQQLGQQGFQAGQQAAANRTGALMGGLQLGGQILGGLFGGGGGFLGGLFK